MKFWEKIFALMLLGILLLSTCKPAPATATAPISDPPTIIPSVTPTLGPPTATPSPTAIGPEGFVSAKPVQPESLTVDQVQNALGKSGPLPETFNEEPRKTEVDSLTAIREQWLAASNITTARIVPMYWASGNNSRWDLIPMNESGVTGWGMLKDPTKTSGWKWTDSPGWDSTIQQGSDFTIRYGLPDKVSVRNHFEIIEISGVLYLVEVQPDGSPVRILDTIRQEMVWLQGALQVDLGDYDIGKTDWANPESWYVLMGSGGKSLNDWLNLVIAQGLVQEKMPLTPQYRKFAIWDDNGETLRLIYKREEGGKSSMVKIAGAIWKVFPDSWSYYIVTYMIITSDQDPVVINLGFSRDHINNSRGADKDYYNKMLEGLSRGTHDLLPLFQYDIGGSHTLCALYEAHVFSWYIYGEDGWKNADIENTQLLSDWTVNQVPPQELSGKSIPGCFNLVK